MRKRHVSCMGSGAHPETGVAATRDVLAPQIAVRSHTRRLLLIDLREVLPTLCVLRVVGDRPEHDGESWLVFWLLWIFGHCVEVACILHAALHESTVVLSGDEDERP